MEHPGTPDAAVIKEIRTLLWGNCPKEDVFNRWAQGVNQLSFCTIIGLKKATFIQQIQTFC